MARALVLGVTILWLTACSATPFVRREVSQAARDASSGILIGAEARSLGSPLSPRAVLLVHGFMGAGSNFGDLPERLAMRGWYVRVMRLPGHGTTPFDLEQTTAEEMLSAVREEYARLKFSHSHVVVIGHSMGATLSTLLAAEAPVDRLVLAAPHFRTPSPWFLPFSMRLASKLAQSHMRWLYKGDLFKQIARAEAKPLVLSYTWVPVQAIVRVDALAEEALEPGVLERIDCPVLWLHSRKDRAAEFEAAQQSFDRLGSSQKQFVELPRTNHVVFFDWDSEIAKEAIVNFVAGSEPRRGGSAAEVARRQIAP